MKIGLLVQRFPGGGAEKYVEEIATRLSKDKIDVTVITSENDHDDSKYDFKIIRLPSILKIGEYHIWRGLEKVLRKEKFDVIHTNTYGYYHSDKAARLKKKLGYKLVMTSHGFTGMDLHKLKKEKIISQSSPFDLLREIYDEKIGIKTLLLCDHLIALSQYDYDFYRQVGVDQSKISIIPPGVSDVFFEEFQKIELKGDPILLSVGQLSWIKNQKMMIKAMPDILKQKPDAHLYLIGPDGGEQDNLQKLCQKLEVSNNVSFLGSKNPEEIRDYMKAADLFLQTSFAEGLSTVLLEVMACGLPFITTPAGGNSTLEGNNTGIIAGFNESEKLSKLVVNLFDDKKIMNNIKNNGQTVSKNYSWEHIFKEIILVYHRLKDE